MSEDTTVLIVTNPVTRDPDRMSLYDVRADSPSQEEVDFIQSMIQVTHHATLMTPDSLSAKHVSDKEIVFPLWAGGKSRNRTAWIPALCELKGNRFIGGDAFVHSACQDKNFSKLIANQFEIETPSGITILSLDDMDRLSNITFPVVVKPLYSGSSLAITESNLCRTRDEALAATHCIFEHGFAPVIVEEFVDGEEYYLSCIFENGNVKYFQAVKWLTRTGESFLHDKIFHFDLKMNWVVDLVMTSCESEIPESVISKIEKMGKYFSPIDIMRFDYRGSPDNMKLIELTPDMNLAPDAEFVGGFHLQGQSYPEIYNKIVSAGIKKYRC
jgi:D-alanine-D-alanine ligase-like ATP-grasp enzyme